MFEIFKNLKSKGSWNQVKGQLKKEYGNLTDDDLTYIEGKEDELVGRLQTKLGLKKDEVISRIKAEAEKV